VLFIHRDVGRFWGWFSRPTKSISKNTVSGWWLSLVEEDLTLFVCLMRFDFEDQQKRDLCERYIQLWWLSLALGDEPTLVSSRHILYEIVRVGTPTEAEGEEVMVYCWEDRDEVLLGRRYLK
jgi:hypothetical protein